MVLGLVSLPLWWGISDINQWLSTDGPQHQTESCQDFAAPQNGYKEPFSPLIMAMISLPLQEVTCVELPLVVLLYTDIKHKGD